MDRHVVLNFSRMSPPTLSGHGKVINKVLEVSREYDAPHFIVLSKSFDKKSNPVLPEDKLNIANTFWKHSNFILSSKEFPSIIQHAKKLNQDGFTHLHVVVGSDRMGELTFKMNKYNGVEYNFDSIQMHSAGDRDPDADDEEGMSASKIRHAVANNETEILSKEYGIYAKLIEHAIRKGL